MCVGPFRGIGVWRSKKWHMIEFYPKQTPGYIAARRFAKWATVELCAECAECTRFLLYSMGASLAAARMAWAKVVKPPPPSSRTA